MTLEEFQEKIGGKHATLMTCQVSGTSFRRHKYNEGDSVNVDLRQAFILYQKMANTPNGEVHRWLPVDATMTAGEMDMMNTHFEKEHEADTGEKPVKIKSHKK